MKISNLKWAWEILKDDIRGFLHRARYGRTKEFYSKISRHLLGDEPCRITTMSIITPDAEDFRHTLAGCRNVYDNHMNFRGVPELPESPSPKEY